ncbi:MAG: hypothetical protein FWG53_00285, partial [Clostridiales bacterium]|nr:hypothetical protein [Clostridiales bacterium]
MQDSQGIQDFYIKKMHIDKVRHLENIDIDIAGDTKRHLILTGKNGSGKTSLLLELNDVLFGARKPVGDNIFNFYYGSDEKSAILVLPNRPPIFKSKWDTFSISTDHRDCIFMLLPADRKLDLQLPKSIEAVDIANDDLRSDVLLKYLLYLNYQKMNALANDDEAEADKVQLWFDMFLSTLREIYECPELTLHHDSKDLSFKIVMPGR